MGLRGAPRLWGPLLLPSLLAVAALLGGGWPASPASSISNSLVVLATPMTPAAGPLHTTTTRAFKVGEAAEAINLVLSRRGGAKGSSSVSGGRRGAGPGGKGKGKGKPAAVIIDEDEEDEEEEEEEEEEWEEDDEEDEYDEEEDEYEEEDEEEMEEYSRGRGSQQRRNGPANDWHYADRRRRMRARKSNSMGITGLVKGAAKLTGNSVSKVAGLFQPNKYVGLREIIGVWKMKQKVSERPGELERCEATVEIRKDGSVVTFFEGKEMVSEFLFKERQWPRSCIIEFEAKAFQGPYDREPQLMFYKGYVKRGLVNSKQVRIEGKIYDVKGTFFWRQKKQIGRFRAIKR